MRQENIIVEKAPLESEDSLCPVFRDADGIRHRVLEFLDKDVPEHFEISAITDPTFSNMGTIYVEATSRNVDDLFNSLNPEPFIED